MKRGLPFRKPLFYTDTFVTVLVIVKDFYGVRSFRAAF